MLQGRGALPHQTIRWLVENRFLIADESHINPASLDLSPTGEMYRVAGMILPRQGERIEDMFDLLQAEPHDPRAAMEVDVTYLLRLAESGHLPKEVYGYCNPKSSTGREGPHVRVLADGVPRYDSLTPEGWSGALWASVVPKTCAIRIPPGEPLCQARLFTRDTRLTEDELRIELDRHRLLWTRDGKMITYRAITVRDGDGSIILTLDASGSTVGWEWVGNGEVLDFSKRDHYDPLSMWRRVPVNKGAIRLHRGGFYILSTSERVMVPPSFACEMAAMDDRAGEFRSHRAGFIDPGWGYGVDGELCGRPITLEVEPFEDLVLRDGQPIARIKFERMTEVPDVLYGTAAKSHYTDQLDARLSKRYKRAA